MKKLALALVFGVVSLGSVSAQTTKTKANKNSNEMKIKQEAGKEGQGRHGKGKEMKSPVERAEHQTIKMTKTLGLTADQATRVKELNLQKAEKMTSLKAKYGEDRKAMGADMKAIKNQYEAGLKNILSSEQLDIYNKEKAEKRAKLKDKKHENSTNQKSK